MKTKKEQIAQITKELIQIAVPEMIKKVDKVLNSGCIDIDSWDENDKPMIIPKIIFTAILQDESHQYECKGTSFEKMIKKEVKNIHYFI